MGLLQKARTVPCKRRSAGFDLKRQINAKLFDTPGISLSNSFIDLDSRPSKALMAFERTMANNSRAAPRGGPAALGRATSDVPIRLAFASESTGVGVNGRADSRVELVDDGQ